MQKEEIDIHLIYSGPDVDNGSMSVEDIIPVLQGFSSAYSKLALNVSKEYSHNLRIVGVRPGSADIILQVWNTIQNNAAAIGASGAIISTGILIIDKIVKLIRFKKHVKNKPFKDKISAENSIVITNSENVSIEFPYDVFELFKSKQLEQDLNKITKPLQDGKIEVAKLKASAPNQDDIEEDITASERIYFESEDIITTSTREAWLVIKFNSLTKSTNSGYAYLGDGSRVFYKYNGTTPAKLYKLFSESDPVRAYCIAHLDDNLRVSTLEIIDLDITQNNLF